MQNEAPSFANIAATRYDYDNLGRGRKYEHYLFDRDAGEWVRVDRVRGAQPLPAAADFEHMIDLVDETRVALELLPGDLIATVADGGEFVGLRLVVSADELAEIPLRVAPVGLDQRIRDLREVRHLFRAAISGDSSKISALRGRPNSYE